MNFEFLKRIINPRKPTLGEDIKRGDEAEMLLASPAFQSAIYRVRSGIHERFAASPVSDIEGQHELRLMLKVLDDIEGNLQIDVNGGKLAKEQMRQENEAAKRKKEREERGFLRSIR